MSAEALHRITLPDDAWVVERNGDRELIEKQKAFHELEMVKQARLETLEVIENMELERPSSRYNDLVLLVTIIDDMFRMEEQKRQEALQELEEIRKNRNSSMEDTDIKNKVLKVMLAKKRHYMKPPL